ncbi:uncharacterized protein TRIADDRAFT_61320 [Trichoplax adhaerens]|uniref:SGF29 C-terminal domain-containing protein n=1 Tax=Trichoplax adhaerens TaxID=10228 RepID=B3SAN3_TRIAD|nr:hypothetical protein TRIADDRAFT_61320 [Trichoplax adhaerens]EDV20185.1 hypothetical protein TRIADDRAFT_61320 [Trichoplax adhaerens]|eukprot:XP_002117346.1 hypothetical protein TRIADDRAFT_61320 [Trichoplax adhaerens]
MPRKRQSQTVSATSVPNAIIPPSGNYSIPTLLRELHSLIHQLQDERTRGANSLLNIRKTHDRMKSEQRVSMYFKQKLRGLYTSAQADAKIEADLIRKALDKIALINALKSDKKQGGRTPTNQSGHNEESSISRKPAPVRKSVLMSILQQEAADLPIWNGKLSESPPPLCGCIPAESGYVAKPGDKVAAKVKVDADEDQWILGEVASHSTFSNKYEIEDIDGEGKHGKERYQLPCRRTTPLPKYKANPSTHPQALYQKHQQVYALYPQTTCFYFGVVHSRPSTIDEEYLVSFEDPSYEHGYSPPLPVPQRYIFTTKAHQRKK